jgi:hypothetical protein
MNGWRNMDESCGISGFCIAMEAETQNKLGTGEMGARKGTETGNRWSGFALRKCALGARILLHQKNPSHARSSSSQTVAAWCIEDVQYLFPHLRKLSCMCARL